MMKTIGILGGMSWESTLSYYRMINQIVKEKKGGLSSARIVMYSFDFGPLAELLAEKRWEALEEELLDKARRLEAAGADFILIATNTMHQVADQVAAGLSVPLLHIAEATAEELLKAGVKKAGLLGTKPTMEMDFYRQKLAARGLAAIIPEAGDRDLMHRIIFEELCLGTIKEESRAAGLAIIDRLAAQGAEAIILGCTELGLLFRPQDTALPLFDTAVIHSRAAALLALA